MLPTGLRWSAVDEDWRGRANYDDNIRKFDCFGPVLPGAENHVHKSLNGKVESRDYIDARKRETATSAPSIEIDESAGMIRVHDSRLINTERRTFCRRLVESAVRQPGIRNGAVDLGSASCQLAFDSTGLTAHEIATAFADLIRQAGTTNSSRARFRRPAESEWLSLHAYSLADGMSVWESFKGEAGQIGLRNQRLAASAEVRARVAEAVLGLQAVKSCRILQETDWIAVEFAQPPRLSSEFWDELERVYEDASANEARATTLRLVADKSDTELAPWPNRFLYLCLAGTSAVMTLVGLVVPGIPTVPFLLATSYFLARSSPAMNERLRHSRFFGPILTEWEEHGGLSERSKRGLTLLTLALFVVAIALAPITPVTIGIVLVVLALSLAGLYRLPSAPEAPRIGAARAGTGPLALATS
jgi:uncharacterized membrane protein YbaN (DUF454 family)